MAYTVWVKEKAKSGWQSVTQEADAESAFRAFRAWLKSRGQAALPLASAVLPVGVYPERRKA